MNEINHAVYSKKELLNDVVQNYINIYALAGNLLLEELSITSKHTFYKDNTLTEFFYNDSIGELHYGNYKAVLYTEIADSISSESNLKTIVEIAKKQKSPDKFIDKMYSKGSLSISVKCFYDLYHKNDLLIERIDSEQGTIVDAFLEVLFDLKRLNHNNFDDDTLKFLTKSRLLLSLSGLHENLKMHQVYPFLAIENEKDYPHEILLQIESNFIIIYIDKNKKNSLYPYTLNLFYKSIEDTKRIKKVYFDSKEKEECYQIGLVKFREAIQTSINMIKDFENGSATFTLD